MTTKYEKYENKYKNKNTSLINNILTFKKHIGVLLYKE